MSTELHMDPYKHSLLSVKRKGGKIEDYYPIHSFMDSTKELCSDNRHRILHNLWGVRRIIVPIFGKVIINSDDREVLVKDICEKDHILPDYNYRFLPSLDNFVDAISNDYEAEIKKKINSFHLEFKFDKEVLDLILSPLAITGQIKSLLITHNSWFVNEIIPKVFKNKIPEIREFNLSPKDLFNIMKHEVWMDNGLHKNRKLTRER